ncbi:MAG: hypothetical protein N2167_01855 [Flavobacteriales bacterium]|nr:hypothetical protein [Flavobacteriales bacterium]
MSNFRIMINGTRATRKAALYAGFFLLITGLLIFAYPKIFAFVVAGILCLLGLIITITALTMRTNVHSKQNQTEDTDYEELENS